MGLSSEVAAILHKEGFTSLASQKHATEDDIQEHNLQHGLHVLLQEALKELQHEHGGGPLCSGPVSAGHKGTLDVLLGKMNLYDHPTANTDTAPVGTGGAVLKIVDFVPSVMVAEEKVALNVHTQIQNTYYQYQ